MLFMFSAFLRQSLSVQFRCLCIRIQKDHKALHSVPVWEGATASSGDERFLAMAGGSGGDLLSHYFRAMARKSIWSSGK